MRPTLTLPEIAAGTAGIGYLNLSPDPDGVFRRLPLLARYGDGFMPSLSLAAVCAYLQVKPTEISIDSGPQLRLRSADKAIGPPRNLRVPLDTRGRLIVNFVGPWHTPIAADTVQNKAGFHKHFDMGTVAFLQYLRDAKAREVLRRSFEAYFPPSIVKLIMANPDLITSTGHKKELTILFSDIQGFTTLTAAMAPDEVRRLLNEYFEVMVEIVFRHGGTVDKFIGDGLMVFFGDPEPQADHAVRCVRAAIEMQRALRDLRDVWERRGAPALHVRIGINTGTVVANMGSARRLSYTVLGAPVNLAQRLEANAGLDGILISARTHELIQTEFPTQSLESLGPIPIKGLTEPVPVYNVLWDKP